MVVVAQVPEETPNYEGRGPEDFASEDVMKEVASGGVPNGRWKEGLMFDGISPQPWLKSAANWMPGTEEVQPVEMRITFMGSVPMLRPGQMNTSIYKYLFTADAGVGAGQKRPPRLSYSARSGPGGSRFANWANGLNGLRASWVD